MDFSFILILALAAGAMFLMTSRTRKQQREAQSFRANLAPGDEVMTGSGLFGTVVDVDEATDVVTIESTPGNRTRWLRAAIAKRVEQPVEEPVDDADADDPTTTTAGAATIASGTSAERTDDLVVPDDLSALDDERTDTERDRRAEGTDDK